MPLYGQPIRAISASNSEFSSGTIRVTGGPNVTVGTDASGVSVSGADAVRAISAGGVSQGSGTVQFGNAGGVSFGLNAGTVTASAPAGGGGGGAKTVSFWQNINMNTALPALASNVAMPNGSLLVQPLNPIADNFDGNMTVSTAMFNLNITGTASSAYSSSFSLGFYSRANTSQLTLVNSAAVVFSRAANASNSLSHNGPRWVTVGTQDWSSSPSFVDGGRYWFGFVGRSSGYGSASIYGQYLGHTIQRSGTMGVNITNSSNSTGAMGWNPFLGVLSASTSALPATIAHTQLNRVNSLAGFIPHLIFNNVYSSF